MSKSAPLVIVDGSSYLYRAFHALPLLTNSKDEHTGAVFGVINMLLKLQKKYKPDYMAVVFDAKGKTFRDDMYAEYKANRPPMPDELRQQIEPLHALVQALGFEMPVVGGVEADDVIGTLALQAVAAGQEVLISTGDKDIAQMVNDKVTLINTMSNTLLDPQGVLDKFGVKPEQIIDYLALVGDSSDNVPGVPKCGPKTAVKWLQQYGSLDAIVEHADEIGGKVGENLRNSLELLSLSRKLVTIKCDVPLDFSVNDLTLNKPDKQKLTQLYTDLEFNTWLKDLQQASDTEVEESAADAEVPVNAEPTTKQDYQTLLTKTEFNTWLKRLKAAEIFAFDTETTSLQTTVAEIVGVSFCIEAGLAAYVPVAHDYPGAPDQLDRDWVLTQLKPLLEDPKKAKLGQNLKYDMSVLANYGIAMQGIVHDTMLESYVLDATATRHDMDSLATKYLQRDTIHFVDIAGKGAKQLTFNQISIEDAGPYAAEDADITLQLHQCLWPQLSALKALQQVYQDIEIPLIPVLSRIERNGVALDTVMLKKQGNELGKSIASIEEQAYEAAGQPFNLSSPKQIQEILFDKLSLTPLRKTPKGQPSTAEDALQEIIDQHPLPGLILQHRTLIKLKSTYVDKLPEMISPKTGRIHTSYRQAVASTGRLSSNDPNLQNIPIRTEEGRRIRKAFVAPKGYKILAADYSQIELRIMAHLSEDQGLLTAFAAGEDIHRATAAEVFVAEREQVTTEQRRAAKAINFGLIYGMSAFGLAKQLGIKRGEAQDYVDKYFARYPGVKQYMENTRLQARSDGFVETVFGRRLYLPTINARNAIQRAAAERTAINAPMQGTAADIIKRAMIDVDAWLTSSGVDAKIIMQVHDELVLEVAEKQLSQVEAELSQRMSAAATLKVPLLVDTDSGDNWDEAH